MARATRFGPSIDVLEDSTASVPAIASSSFAASDALIDLDTDQAQNVQTSLTTAKTHVSADSLAVDLKKLHIGDDGKAWFKENIAPGPQVAHQQLLVPDSFANETAAGIESAGSRRKVNHHVEFVTPADTAANEVEVAAEPQGPSPRFAFN